MYLKIDSSKKNLEKLSSTLAAALVSNNPKHKEMAAIDTGSLHAQSLDGSPPTRNGSESEILQKKPRGTEGMSRIHDIALIVTICMAQILALAGLGQALGTQSSIH